MVPWWVTVTACFMAHVAWEVFYLQESGIYISKLTASARPLNCISLLHTAMDRQQGDLLGWKKQQLKFWERENHLNSFLDKKMSSVSFWWWDWNLQPPSHSMVAFTHLGMPITLIIWPLEVWLPDRCCSVFYFWNTEKWMSYPAGPVRGVTLFSELSTRMKSRSTPPLAISSSVLAISKVTMTTQVTVCGARKYQHYHDYGRHKLEFDS